MMATEEMDAYANELYEKEQQKEQRQEEINEQMEDPSLSDDEYNNLVDEYNNLNN